MSVEITVKGLLDKLPASVRHTLLMFVASLLAWAATAATEFQIADNPVLTGVVVSAATSLVATATLWFTRLTKQYGIGSEEPVE